MPIAARRLTRTFASLILVVMVAVADARADITITFEQVGTNVVETGTGAIDLTGLTSGSTGPLAVPPLNPSQGTAITGLATFPTMLTIYTGFTGPSSFGSGGNATPNTETGDILGISAHFGDLAVPAGYTSGTSLSATDTFDSSTFSSLGLTAGTYTYRWGTGGTDHTLTVQIGPAAATVVPEPSTALVAMVGAVAFVTYGWRLRRRQQRRQVSA
jgi:PEP-CTERM motif